MHWFIYLFIFKQALTDSLNIHFYYMEMRNQDILQKYNLINMKEKVIWVWNEMGVNKWSQYFYFCMSYPFNTVFSHLC